MFARSAPHRILSKSVLNPGNRLPRIDDNDFSTRLMTAPGARERLIPT